MKIESVKAYYGSEELNNQTEEELDFKKRELLNQLSVYILQNNLANFVVEPHKVSIEMHIAAPENWTFNFLTDVNEALK